MNDALLELSPIGLEQLVSITQNVWSSLLAVELTAVPDEAAVLTGPVLLAVVRISGAWQGRVELECSSDQAHAAAAVMFGAETTSADEAADAVGELANIVSGNVKSLLPAPSAMSVPSVRPAGSTTGVPRGTPREGWQRVCAAVLDAAPGPLRVSIWKEHRA